MKHNAWKESFMRGVFFIAACASVLAVALICIFLFANGLPAMKEIGFGKFLSGTLWRPKNNIFGILPMIVGSLYVTAGAIIFGVPIGILTSVYMAHVLSEADLSSTEDGNRTSGRYSFRSIWIFWIGRPGAVDKEHCQIPAACRHYQTIRKW